jgi:hypothetical protein
VFLDMEHDIADGLGRPDSGGATGGAKPLWHILGC